MTVLPYTALALFAPFHEPTLGEKVDALLASPALEGGLSSVTITDRDGMVLYEHNSGVRVVPASNQKLLTNIFAFATLSPDYRPLTRFARQGDKVYVDSAGDPEMSWAELQQMGKALEIPRGAKVFTKLAYNPGYGPSWEWDDLPNRYAPKITAFCVEEAGFTLRSKDHEVLPLAPALGVEVLRRREEQGATVDFDPASGRLRVRGELSKEEKVLDTLAQPNPLATSCAVLGGKWSGMVTNLPEGLAWTDHLGKTLYEISKECLVDSDNHSAEHLLLMSASKLKPLPERREYSVASDLMAEFYRKILAHPNDFRPTDGSGLSRHNFVTTRGLTEILRWAFAQPWGEQFRSALVKAGDGTLKGRNPGKTFCGKTGTLNSVISLSGTVTNTVGKERFVSVIFNHSISSTREQREVADAIMRTVEEDASAVTENDAAANSRKMENRSSFQIAPLAPRNWAH